MEGEDFYSKKILSDLLGFYTFKNKKVIFKDSNSLVTRMLYNLSDKYNFELIEATK